MNHIIVRNVNHALREGFWLLKTNGVAESSRNGPVLVAPWPVLTEYTHPQERVLFNAKRDANPVFHLMESIWMLAGQGQVDWLLPFNSRFKQYAEDNGFVYGAYGYRWMKHFGVDQIQVVVNMLKHDPYTRRAVIGMWDPESDLNAPVRDVPCNTTIYFGISNGLLDMTVCCRSNDVLWGAYGANAVHMSMLQEVIAAGVNVPMGAYRQFSNNYHVYTDLPIVQEFLQAPPFVIDNCYEGLTIMPLVGEGEQYQDFISDCHTLVGGGGRYVTEFFRSVAAPLHDMYLTRKDGGAIAIPLGLSKTDWGTAFREWCVRRGANL